MNNDNERTMRPPGDSESRCCADGGGGLGMAGALLRQTAQHGALRVCGPGDTGEWVGLPGAVVMKKRANGVTVGGYDVYKN